jgi:hypothetical protein
LFVCRYYIKDVYGQQTEVWVGKEDAVQTVMERGLECTPSIVIATGGVVALKRKFHVSDGYIICNSDK